MAETKYVSSGNLAYYDSLVKGRDAQKSEIPTKLTDLNNDGDFVRDAAYKHTDNNYTDAEKTKLAGVADGAQVNSIDAVTVNGKAAAISNKTVNITVPTDNKDLTNGAGYRTDAQVRSTVESYGYQTSDEVESAIAAKGYQTAANVKATVEGYGYQTAANVQSAISKAGHLSRKVVDALPTTGEDNVIYLVPSASSKTGNVKDEYMWIESKWERVGSSETDLTGYVKESELVAMTTGEIDALFA